MISKAACTATTAALLLWSTPTLADDKRETTRPATGALITGIAFCAMAGLNGFGMLLHTSTDEPILAEPREDTAIMYGIAGGISAAIGLPVLLYGASRSNFDVAAGPAGARASWRF